MKKFTLFVLILVILGIAFWFAKPFFIQPPSIEEVSVEELSDFKIVEDMPKTEPTAANDEAPLEDPGDPDVLPTFIEVPLDFTHSYDSSTLAFAGGSIIDTNGDGIEEIFVTGGNNQSDALFFYENGNFVNKIEGSGLSNNATTYGSVSADMDNDNDTDMVIARDNGLYLYLNEQGRFTGQKLDVSLAANTVPLAITAADIDRDGFLDLYISTFVNAATFRSAVFNDASHGKPNVLLRNNGDNTFADITEQSGLIVNQNTFLSVFVDLNNDGWQDLVVAENTGLLKVFKNEGNVKFSEIPKLSDYGFWMGLTVGDIDQDGDQDIFATNIGNTIPVNSARGDLRSDQKLNPEWLLLRNDGNFEFSDATAEKKLAGFEFAWGAVLEDFNLNGRLDLMVTENYIKWPAHKLSKLPGRFFLQNKDGSFVAVTKLAGLENFHYGMTPLTSDFNQDGYLDMVMINLDGPARAFLNKGGSNHYLNVKLPDSAKSYGARVTVTKHDGTKLHKHLVNGEGLLSDQSSILTFGLGRSRKVESVEVVWPSGEETVLNDVKVDSVLKID